MFFVKSSAVASLILAGLAVGCSAPEAADSDVASTMLSAPSADWYEGTFSGTCVQEGRLPSSYKLEVLKRDGFLIIRTPPPPPLANGLVLTIDTTIFQMRIGADGSFHDESIDEPYRFELNGRCDAGQCAFLSKSTYDQHDVGSGSWTMTRTEAGMDWHRTGSEYDFDDKDGTIVLLEEYKMSETCTMTRTK